MKKNLIFLFIIYSNLIFSQTKLIKYTYEASFENTDLKNEYIGSYLQSIERGAKHLEIELLFNDTISLFRSKKSVNIDDNEDIEKAKVGCNCSEETFQLHNFNYRNNSTVFFPEKKYLIKDEIDNTWILESDTITINNLLCYKAYRSVEKTLSNGDKSATNVIAWYCPELKGSYGPAGFGGLPGIILFLQNGNNIYKAKELIMDYSEDIKFDKIGIEISKEEYLNKINTFDEE